MAAASGKPAELDEAMPPGCTEGRDRGLGGRGGLMHHRRCFNVANGRGGADG